ncbi:unnamed protein product [Sphagnum troendelagicum]|uniref:Uncharacterized protein n=1 Tax=Sphagnum troendelagicum TaxID=128251 RepID=A0ABP0UVN0_9BRYO
MDVSRSSSSSSSSAATAAASCCICLAILHGHEGNVISLALAGDMLYSGSDRGDIQAWKNNPQFRKAKRFGSGEGSVKSLVVVDDKVISAHQDCKIRVWRKSKGKSNRLHQLVISMPSMKAFLINFLTPNNNYVQVRRQCEKALWTDHHDAISVLAVGTDVLYSGSWDKSIKVWRLSDFRCLESLTSHIDAVNALAVDRKRGLLYSGSADATIKVWQRHYSNPPATHTLITTLEEAKKSPVNALALSPDAEVLYSGASNKTITVWKRLELRGGRKHMVPAGLLRGHRLAVLCLSTIADLLISGSADKTICIWRRGATDGLHSCVSLLQGHKGPVKSLCTSADTTRMGFMVYSGSMDCDVRVWWIPPDQEREAENLTSDGSQESPPPSVRWSNNNNHHPSNMMSLPSL